MGSGHFLRRSGPGYIEQHLREAGANSCLIIAGTNTVGAGEIEHRFDDWTGPSIISTTASWVSELPAQPVISGGAPGAVAAVSAEAQRGSTPAHPPTLKLHDAADALPYLGPADTLIEIYMGREELEGTAYGKELTRRSDIMFGYATNFIPDQPEVPQFSRPHMTGGASGIPASLPPPPKSIHDPLPPRPLSQ